MRFKEKRPKKQKSKKAILHRIVKKQGKTKKKFHRFLQSTGDFLLDRIDSYYQPENYGKTWEFDKQGIPRPILKD